MNKKTISIILAYVGVLTGAGLASGQELMQYFVSFGKLGIFGLIVVGILHIFVGGIILQLGSHFIAESHIDVLEELTRKKLDDDLEFSRKDRQKLDKLAEASIIDDDKIKEAVEEEIEEEMEEENNN